MLDMLQLLIDYVDATYDDPEYKRMVRESVAACRDMLTMRQLRQTPCWIEDEAKWCRDQLAIHAPNKPGII